MGPALLQRPLGPFQYCATVCVERWVTRLHTHEMYLYYISYLQTVHLLIFQVVARFCHAMGLEDSPEAGGSQECSMPYETACTLSACVSTL